MYDFRNLSSGEIDGRTQVVSNFGLCLYNFLALTNCMLTVKNDIILSIK